MLLSMIIITGVFFSGKQTCKLSFSGESIGEEKLFLFRAGKIEENQEKIER